MEKVRRTALGRPLLLSFLALPAGAQAPANKSFAATVAAFKSATQIEFKADSGALPNVTITQTPLRHSRKQSHLSAGSVFSSG